MVDREWHELMADADDPAGYIGGCNDKTQTSKVHSDSGLIGHASRLEPAEARGGSCWGCKNPSCAATNQSGYEVHIPSVEQICSHGFKLWLLKVQREAAVHKSSPRMSVTIVSFPGLSRPLCCAVEHAGQPSDESSVTESFGNDFSAAFNADRQGAGKLGEVASILHASCGDGTTPSHDTGK